MTEYVDWEPAGDPVGLVVLLPGRGYTCAMPLLSFARQVALQHGWAVREVWWDLPRLGSAETVEWVTSQLRAAVGEHPAPVRVIAKSVGTVAAAYAADQGYDAVWLTPILTDPDVAVAMRAHPGRQLLVGGSADGYWDRSLAREVAADVLDVPGADHSLATPEDTVRTAEIHLEVTRAIDAWFASGSG